MHVQTTQGYDYDYVGSMPWLCGSWSVSWLPHIAVISWYCVQTTVDSAEYKCQAIHFCFYPYPVMDYRWQSSCTECRWQSILGMGGTLPVLGACVILLKVGFTLFIYQTTICPSCMLLLPLIGINTGGILGSPPSHWYVPLWVFILNFFLGEHAPRPH